MTSLEEIGIVLGQFDWPTIVTATATAVLAVLTGSYVRLTKKILSAQSDPCVVVTVVHDEHRATMLQLVAKNIDSGMAHDIRFEFNYPIPARAFGVAEADAKDSTTMTDGPFISGIPALGPGDVRKVDWGQFGGLQKALGGRKIVATCRFKKDGKEMPPTKCPLEVESFLGTVASESIEARVVKSLDSISKDLGHIASGYKKVKIELFNPDAGFDSRVQSTPPAASPNPPPPPTGSPPAN